jgi:hypothetical protein
VKVPEASILAGVAALLALAIRIAVVGADVANGHDALAEGERRFGAVAHALPPQARVGYVARRTGTTTAAVSRDVAAMMTEVVVRYIESGEVPPMPAADAAALRSWGDAYVAAEHPGRAAGDGSVIADRERIGAAIAAWLEPKAWEYDVLTARLALAPRDVRPLEEVSEDDPVVVDLPEATDVQAFATERGLVVLERFGGGLALLGSPALAEAHEDPPSGPAGPDGAEAGRGR